MLFGNHICSAIAHGRRKSGECKKWLELLEACVRVEKEGRFWRNRRFKKNLPNGIGSTCSKWPIVGHHIQPKKEKRRVSAPSWWQHSPYPLFLRRISFGRWDRDVSPLSQPTRSYTSSRQQSTCLLSTACIWIHTCQASRQASLWITPPTVRNMGARDLRSAVILPRLVALFS